MVAMTSLGGMTSCRLYSSGFCVAGSPSVWLLVWFARARCRVSPAVCFSWIALFAGVGDGGCVRFDVGCLLMLSSARMIRGMLMMSAVAVSMVVPTHHRMMLRLLGAFFVPWFAMGESPCVAYCRMLASRCLIGTCAA